MSLSIARLPFAHFRSAPVNKVAAFAAQRHPPRTCSQPRYVFVRGQSVAVSFPFFPYSLNNHSCATTHARCVACCSAEEVLELSEDSVEEVLQAAKLELQQLFDESVGITGTVQLAELDGPFVKLRLQGRFWHKRSDVLARVAAYLQRRIPDIMEVEIEDETQLDDSATQF